MSLNLHFKLDGKLVGFPWQTTTAETMSVFKERGHFFNSLQGKAALAAYEGVVARKMAPVAHLVEQLEKLKAKTELTYSEQSKFFNLTKELEVSAPVFLETLEKYRKMLDSANAIELFWA